MAASPDIREDTASASYFATTLPAWQKVLWHQISEAAQAKYVFDKGDYDENGNLNMHLAKFKDLYRWIVGRNIEEQFKTLQPDWRYVNDIRWELTFLVIVNDRPAADDPEGSNEGIQVRRRKRTDIFIDGLKSSTKKDWVTIQSEALPSHGDLPKGNMGSRKHCCVM
ncbi:hypothetical protein Q7P37_004327 [Cladosporium fusiforme]